MHIIVTDAPRDLRSAKRAEVESRDTDNVTAIRWWGPELFEPSDLRSVYILEQAEPGIWSYYSLTRIAGNSWLSGGHDKSYHRILAMFRDLASIQSDLEPPPAL